MMRDADLKSLAVLVGIAAGLVLFCFYFLLLGPQLAKYQRDSLSLTTEGERLQRARATVAASAGERDQLSAASKKMLQMAGRFQGKLSSGSAMVLLGTKAAAKGVTITGIEPGEPSQSRNLIRFPLTVTLKGDYLGLLAYCGEIEQDGLGDLTDIDGLQLTIPQEEMVKRFRAPAASSQEMVAFQPGEVKAELKLAIYANRTAGAPLCQDQVEGWQLGRSNPFEFAGTVEPGLSEDSRPLPLPVEATR